MSESKAKLTKKQMAVEVAKDVIAQLKKRNNKMVVMDGNTYLESYVTFSEDELDKDFQQFIPRLMKEGCTVCARGAALISKIKLYNKVSVDQIVSPKHNYNTLGYNNRLDVNQKDTTEILASVFSKTNLDLIEMAFEVNLCSDNKIQKNSYGAVVFGSKFADSKKRLIAIMQNIIDNGGDFIVKPATIEEAYQAMGY